MYGKKNKILFVFLTMLCTQCFGMQDDDMYRIGKIQFALFESLLKSSPVLYAKVSSWKEETKRQDPSYHCGCGKVRRCLDVEKIASELHDKFYKNIVLKENPNLAMTCSSSWPRNIYYGWEQSVLRLYGYIQLQRGSDMYVSSMWLGPWLKIHCHSWIRIFNDSLIMIETAEKIPQPFREKLKRKGRSMHIFNLYMYKYFFPEKFGLHKKTEDMFFHFE